MVESKAMRVWFGTALLTCAIFSGEALSAQDKQPSVSSAPGQKPDPEATTGNSTVSVTLDEPHRIEPNDMVQIDVWNQPEITRTIPVRPDGRISLPLLNDVQAAGLTAMQLAGSIREGLTKFLTNSQVTVTVSQIAKIPGVHSPNKVMPPEVIPQYKPLPPNRAVPYERYDPELKQKCCVA